MNKQKKSILQVTVFPHPGSIALNNNLNDFYIKWMDDSSTKNCPENCAVCRIAEKCSEYSFVFGKHKNRTFF